MRTPFGSRLFDAVAERGHLCAGIDPHPSLLTEWGLADDAAGLERFSLTAVEGLAGEVPVIKPQSAFFERHGAAGIAVLERVISEARAAGALVLLDVKRGDIGSTSAAYAEAYLDPSAPLGCDALTVSPYLGFGSLTPFVESARRHGGGLFVLALTSNPEGEQVQRAVPADGVAPTVAELILDRLRELNAGAEPLGSFGAVIGATLPELPAPPSFHGPILAPGFGAQGGSVADLTRLFGAAGRQVVASSSRGLLRAGPSVTGLRDAARRTRDELGELG